MNILKDTLNHLEKKQEIAEKIAEKQKKEGEREKMEEKILSTFTDITKNTKQLFGAEVSQDTLSAYIESFYFPSLTEYRNMGLTKEEKLEKTLKALEEIKEKGLERSILDHYGRDYSDITKKIHLEAFEGNRPLAMIDPTIKEITGEMYRRRIHAEYSLFEKSPNQENMRKGIGGIQELMMKSYDRDNGGVIFGFQLSEDQYQLLYYGEYEKALKKGKKITEIEKTISNGGLNALLPQNGYTKEDFQKHCNDFIKKQKALGEHIKFPKAEKPQKRVSPQVKAEQEKKAQKQGRGR